MSYYEVDLRGGGPWGFRLQGGKDFGQALSISRITPGGKADVQGIAAGDIIYSINEQVVENMSHMDAQNCIKNAGHDLKLTLQRSKGGSDNNNRSPIVINQTKHSAKSDHKFNAKPRPFGAPSSSPSSSPSPPQSVSPAYYPPPPPPAPQATHTSYAAPRKAPVNPPDDSDVLRRLQETKIHDDTSSGLKSAASNVDSFQREMNRLQLASSEGDGDETEYMGYMRQPEESGLSRAKVQSKSFKMLQHHLGTDDDLPPPPPEAYLEEEDNQPQSRTFQMLQNSVDGGAESHPSVFSRPVEDRSKASNIPLPKQYQPHNPTPIKRAGAANLSQVSHPGAPTVLPGQPQPVALPGMIKKQPVPPPTAPHVHPVPSLGRDPGSRSGAVPAPPPAPANYGIPPPRSNNPPPQVHGPPKAGGGPGGQRAPQQQPSGPRAGGPKPAGGRDGPRAPYCNGCNEPINGPFVSAIGKSWHPEHFRCASCDRPLQDIGFVEEQGKLYCENDYNQHFAPRCADCNQPITGPCVQAIGQNFHPEHFRCGACGKELGNEGFMLDGGKPFCQKCYKDFFCVKCAGCKNVIGGLDRWIEAIDATWHAACFCCCDCNRPLENSEFFVASGKPYCPEHGSMR